MKESPVPGPVKLRNISSSVDPVRVGRVPDLTSVLTPVWPAEHVLQAERQRVVEVTDPPASGLGFRVQGFPGDDSVYLGFRVQGFPGDDSVYLGFRVQGFPGNDSVYLGFRVQGFPGDDSVS